MRIPDTQKCIWCGGTMERRGITALGSGPNYFSMWCTKCNGITIHITHTNKKITSIDHKIHYEGEKENG